ncbi:MAG: CHASE domain-containing protein [Magnetococcales bacterium]|nr:CHASE domain-containing protein [Magnetococcales bacterium]
MGCVDQQSRYRRQKSIVCWLVVHLFLCCSLGQLFAEEARKTVTAAVLRDFPPLSMIGKDGKPYGLAIEQMEFLAGVLNWKVQYRLVENWQEAAQAVREGEADLSPTVAITPQWEKEFLFSDPVLTTLVSCFVTEENSSITSCDNLTGRSITVVQQGAAYQQLSKRTDIQLVPAINLEAAIYSLLNKQADLLIAPQPSVMAKREWQSSPRRVRVIGNPFLEIRRGVLLSRQHSDWLTSLNSAVVVWKNSRQFQAAFRQYYADTADLKKKEGESDGIIADWLPVWLAAVLLAAFVAWRKSWLRVSGWTVSSNFFLRKETAWIVLLFAGVVTVIYWYFSWKAAESRNNDRIEYTVEEARQAISKRMLEYEQVLRSGVALFNARRNEVDRRLWHDFVATLQIDTYWPGIQGIGFSLMIPAAEKEAHLAQIRREGYADYTIRPEGERSLYSSIIFLEPFRDRNLRAFGYDMFSEPVRRAAMERARDTGLASLSGPVRLVQETSTDVQVGFLLYLPVYRAGVSLETVEKRRQALVGFVYSPFRTKDLMRGILGHGIPDMDFAVYDGLEISEENRLYSSVGNDTVRSVQQKALYTVSRTEVILGRVWTVVFHSRPEFEQRLSSNQPWLVLALGVFIDLLLFLLFRFLAARQEEVQREVKRTSRELHQSEVRYQQLVDNIHDVIFQTDRQGCWQFLNPAWEEISGYTVQESLHRPFLTYTHPQFHGQLLQQFQDLLDGFIPYYRDEVIGLRRDGTPVWVELYSGARLNEHGHIIGSFGTLRDISARRQAEEAAYAAREAAEAANRAKSEFLANMSHELRTPLNSMLILSKLLANDRNLGNEQQDSARIIHESGSDLLRLINDILDLSKAEAGRLDVVATSISFASLLESLQRQFRPVAFSRRLQWSQSLALDLPGQLVTDPIKVEQILRNLLSNAFKFTERGGVHLAIERPSAEETFHQPGLSAGNTVALRVKDSGIGIPADKFELIFESFQQVETTTSRKYGGTGLGLTIARRFASLLGGEIHLQSQLGAGTLFSLILPLAFPYPDKILAVTSDPDRVRSEEVVADFRHPGARILIVDDDERNRLALQKSLAGRAGQLYFAVDGADALQVLQAHTEINLVLMDIMMPRMDGYQAMREIRNQPRFAQLPIIALTAKAMPGDKERCLQAGANDYLAKPVVLERLFAVLQEWLSHVAVAEAVAEEQARRPPVATAITDQPFEPASALLPQGELDKNLLLVGEDVRRNFLLAQQLQQRVARVQIAGNAQQLFRLLAERQAVHLLIADYSVNAPELQSILHQLRQGKGMAHHCPLLVLTAETEQHAWQTLLAEGANRCLQRNAAPEALWETVLSMLEK